MRAVHLFAGPTLSGCTLPAEVVHHPPAAAGDLLALEAEPPATIVLIDGTFGRRRAVWHRECLALMAAGHRLIGAASMGALRAAELHTEGMEGVGLVFRAFRAGRLADDGEVAVAHGPAELGWRPLGPALVDVRWSASLARRKGCLSAREASRLVARAAAIPFVQRRWELVLAVLARGHPFRALGPAAERSVKARDALLAVAQALGPAPPRAVCAPPPETGWRARLQPALSPQGAGGGATGRERSNSTRK